MTNTKMNILKATEGANLVTIMTTWQKQTIGFIIQVRTRCFSNFAGGGRGQQPGRPHLLGASMEPGDGNSYGLRQGPVVGSCYRTTWSVLRNDR